MKVILYDEAGRITHKIEGEYENLRGMTQERMLHVFEFPDDATEYVKDGFILPRPSLPIPENLSILANGIDSVKFVFPEKLNVSVEGVVVETDTLDLSSDHPDVYDIRINQWPYLPYHVQVIAT